MKTNQEKIPVYETPDESETRSGIFTETHHEPFLSLFHEEYTHYLDQDGQVSMFFFMEMKIRMIRADGDYDRASQYGLVCLFLYEQELLKAYKWMDSDENLPMDEKKDAILWVLSRMRIREIMWLMQLWEHQEIIKELFQYWKERFENILEPYQEMKSQNNSRDVAEIVSLSGQEFFRILNGD